MPNRMLLKAALAALSAGVIAVSYLALLTPTLGNLWDLSTGAGFFIPSESSVFTFTVTKYNTGSGEWWLYGEDSGHFYCYDRSGSIGNYLLISRQKASTQKGFDPVNFDTWPPEFVQTHSK